MNLLGRDSRIACEVEVFELLHARQTGFADTPLNQPLFPFLEFGLQQRFEIAEVSPPFARGLFGQLSALGRDGRHQQLLALLSYSGRFHPLAEQPVVIRHYRQGTFEA
jgi:hypothetical protein